MNGGWCKIDIAIPTPQCFNAYKNGDEWGMVYDRHCYTNTTMLQYASPASPGSPALLFHQGVQVVHLLAEALALRRHLADDGADLAQDVGPAEATGQHDPGADHAFQNVAGAEVPVAHLGTLWM